jgi:excisionase family DNA binding protein
VHGILFFTIDRAAKYLRKSPRKVSQLCRDGKIRHSIDGGRHLFTEEMLREYVDNHTVPVKKSATPVTKPRRRAASPGQEPSEESSLADIRRDLKALRKGSD